MPCYDHRCGPGNWTEYRDVTVNGLTAREFDAILCGIVHSQRIDLDAVDWKEVGLSKEVFLRWQKAHETQDRRKTQARRAAAEREALAKSAIAKLSRDELQALKERGFK